MPISHHPVQVVILEDDPGALSWLAEGISSQPELVLVATFQTLRDAQYWFSDHDADVLLADLALPDGNGLTLIRDVAARRCADGTPRTDVLVISIFGDAETVLESIEAGAVGYLHKDASPPDMAQVILDVRRGASPISPMIARGLLARFRRIVSSEHEQRPHSSHSRRENTDRAGIVLTPAETEVLALIARGFTYAEICRERGVAISTVQSQVKVLYSKLAVHSRSQAVYTAHRLGLIDATD